MRLRRFLAEDEGSALIAVIGIMIVLTVLAEGAFLMSDNSLFEAKRDRSSAQALAVAEAGVEQTLWRIRVGEAPVSGVPFSIEVTPGVVTIEPEQTGMTWHIVAVGSVGTSPTVQRTISVDVLAMSMWDMFYSNAEVSPGANGHINGSGTFHGSMYMRGNWPPSNGNAAFEVGPFFVKDGDVDLGGSATIGSGGKVELYCNGVVNPVGVNANLHTNVPDLPMPKQDDNFLTGARQDAWNEASDTFQGTPTGGNLSNEELRVTGDATGAPSPRSGSYKLVDDDSTTNRSLTAFYIGTAANGTLIPSFGVPYDPTLGHSKDDFAWDAATGVLTVQGTVFIDAQDLYIKDVKWAGKGKIVCTGNVHITGKWEPACLTVDPIATDPENELGYPKKNCVGISASGAVEQYSPDGYGPFYSNTSWSMDPDPGANDHQFHGTIMAPEITLGKHSDVWCTPNMGANIPAGMPGPVGQIVAVSGWHEGRR